MADGRRLVWAEKASLPAGAILTRSSDGAWAKSPSYEPACRSMFRSLAVRLLLWQVVL